MVAATLTPKAGESQAEFAFRFHEAMREAIPDTDERTERCFQIWDETSGKADPVERRASRRFNPEKYQRVRNIPVFAEHTTKRRNKDGAEEVVVYDRRALAAIVDRCNRRISDTGDFAALTAGHTPTLKEMEQGASMPPRLGWSGPFRLGMIGNDHPRWAIFSDEWHDRKHEDALDEMRRRSPEVWLESRMEDRYLDPIAALGAETPRLDLGVATYSRRQDGTLIERYSATPVDIDHYTATFPGAGSVFVPGGADDKDHYQAGDTRMPLSPDDVNQVVQALMETAPIQWVLSKMDEGPQTGADDPATGAPPVSEPPMEAPSAPVDPPAAPPAADTPPPPPAAEPPAAPPSDEPPEDPDRKAARYQCDDEDQEAIGRYMAGDMDDQQFQQYMAGKRGRYQADSPPDPEEVEMPTDQYSRQRDRVERAKYSKLEQRLNQLEEERKAERQRADRAERYSKLNELRMEGCVLDVDREMEETADFSPQQFERHLDRIVERYSRVPMNARLPVDALPLPKARGNEDSAEVAEEAQRYCISQREAGNLKYTYNEALEHVREKRKAAAAAKTV